MADRYVRHDLVRFDPGAWAASLRTRADLDGVPYLPGWAEAGRPLIVRRYGPGEPRDRVPLGLPLPPADGKRRIGLAAPAADLAPYRAPLLAEVINAAPAAWRPTLEALVVLGRRHDTDPRPFGALLWQAVTGLAYLTPDSDLDLLWPLGASLPVGLLDGLAEIGCRAPMRLDGELLLPDGFGVHWRELHEASDGSSVLAKHRDHLDMRPVSALRGRIAA